MVRIPKTSTIRNRPDWAKLLTSVDPQAKDGFGFEGTYISPGRLVSEADLRPTPAHPPIPILLEMCLLGETKRGKRSPMTYILWRYQGGKWHEIARSEGLSWEWAIDLRPIAIRALQASRGAIAEDATPDLEATAGRIAEFLDEQIAALDAVDRARVLSTLHDVLAERLCSLGRVGQSVG